MYAPFIPSPKNNTVRTVKRFCRNIQRKVIIRRVVVVGPLLLLVTVLWQQFAVLGPSWASLGFRPEAVVGTPVTDYPRTLPGRLAEAVFIATELKRSDSYLQLMCPDNQAIGGRPPNHLPPVIGTTCEAWANREWMEVVWHVVDRNMIALEWSSGSGSLWTLRRGLTLYTVEHW